MKRFFIFGCLGFSALFGFSNSTPVKAPDGMVVGPEPQAVRVGLEILRAGGNAFDAAAAVGFALAVTYPTAGNLGGGGFMVALTHDGKKIALDFRETAPAAATRNMFLDKDGNPVKDLSTQSLLASGTPGSVHGLLRFQEDYGTFPRSRIITPAIHLAEKGFPVSYALADAIQDNTKLLLNFETTKSLFFPDGKPLKVGTKLKQPDLTRTLKAIRRQGAAGFYEGAVADSLVAFMQKHGGIMTHADLKHYSPRYREPLIFQYKDYEVITHPLPSSGGVTLAQILKLIEPFSLKDLGYQSAEYVHLLTEAERLAFVDRNFYLGDGDFIKAPIRRLLADDYISQRRTQIPKDRAGSSRQVAPGRWEAGETTHFCVVDRERNVVAITTTLNGSFGMGAIVEGAGFFLNNEMDDFSIKPGEPNMAGLVQGEANAIQPGKRMLSSMTPTIVLRNGKFDFTIGSPGGPTIITTVAQVFLNLTDFGMNIREAIDTGRFHHQYLPDQISYEKYSLSPDTLSLLKKMGYALKEIHSLGDAEGIRITKEGYLTGYNDRRGSGLAAGY